MPAEVAESDNFLQPADSDYKDYGDEDEQVEVNANNHYTSNTGQDHILRKEYDKNNQQQQQRSKQQQQQRNSRRKDSTRVPLMDSFQPRSSGSGGGGIGFDRTRLMSSSSSSSIYYSSNKLLTSQLSLAIFILIVIQVTNNNIYYCNNLFNSMSSISLALFQRRIASKNN